MENLFKFASSAAKNRAKTFAFGLTFDLVAWFTQSIGVCVVRIIPLLKAVQRPWKNGGGLTREIFVSKSNDDVSDFLWRLSYATVSQSGPFSIFVDVDRWLIQTAGDSMTLHFEDEGRAETLKIFSPFAFKGEAKIDCKLGKTSTEDLNFMVNRRRHAGSMQVLHEAKSIHEAWQRNGMPSWLHVLSGTLSFDGMSLSKGDTLLMTEDAAMSSGDDSWSGSNFQVAVGWVK
jgi:environmental stress-induced protein Ves